MDDLANKGGTVSIFAEANMGRSPSVFHSLMRLCRIGMEVVMIQTVEAVVVPHHAPVQEAP